jgi:hypothetical protein
MIRVRKGNPDDAELAAVTVVLLAVTAGRGPDDTCRGEFASWRDPQWSNRNSGPWRKPGHAVLSWRGHRFAGKG